MSTPNEQALPAREQRVLAALRGFGQDRRRFAVSVAEIAQVVGLSCGQTSRALTKLWLLGRIRVQQAPSASEPSVVELLPDAGPDPPADPGAEPPAASPRASAPEVPSPETEMNNPQTETNIQIETTPDPPLAPSASVTDPANQLPPLRSPEEGKGGRGDEEESGDDVLIVGDDDGDDGNVNDEFYKNSDANVDDAVGDDDADDAPAVPGGGSRGEEADTAGLTPVPEPARQCTGTVAQAHRTDPAGQLARRCAEALGDTGNLRAYFRLANRYPAQRLLDALATVQRIPAEEIRSPGGLFTHFVKHGA